ncbi:MAG TPA: serine/threonine-protein kinase [Ktedonobacteraceae bacterium]|jgi:serine/threonine protein kinase|nr:serine/threonine-protein kinase [Ktedonobacteraceae bacterium]
MTRGQHLIGKVLGSCVLEKLLGHGGSSAVFLAQQQSPARKVAVKVFLPRTVMDAQMRQDFYLRFLSEAEAASKLDHPHILPIYSYGEEDGLPYIVMPYMEGGTLAEYLSQRGPLALAEALWYLEQITSALDYAHAHGCVHCDVKPANILLDHEGYALLSDFGIARVIQINGDLIEPQVRYREAVMGTPDYISPEQALGRAIDGRSDIYSLGVMLFYLLTKRLPFRADTSIALALLHVHEPPPSLTSIRTDLAPEVDRAVLKALAKDPDERFQNADQFKRAFAQAVAASERATSGNTYVKETARAIRSLLAWRAPLRIFALTIPRLVGVIALLSVLICGGLISASYVTASHALGGTRVPQATPAGSHTAMIDYLSRRGNWPLSSTFFYDQQQQSYHVVNTSAKNVALALYTGRSFHNFRLNVMMSEVHGSHDGADYYGVVFRCASDQSRYYLFEMVTSGDQQYSFLRYDNGQWQRLAGGSSSALLTSGAQPDTVTIDAYNNTFSFFINGKRAGNPVTDHAMPALNAGQIGLYVEEQGVEVAFSHLYVNALR